MRLLEFAPANTVVIICFAPPQAEIVKEWTLKRPPFIINLRKYPLLQSELFQFFAQL